MRIDHSKYARVVNESIAAVFMVNTHATSAFEEFHLCEMRARKAPIWPQLAEFRCSPQILNKEVTRLGLPSMKQPIDKRKFAERWEAGASIKELMCEFGRGESINQGMAARELPSSGIEIGGLASVIVRVSSAAGDFT